jgi:hypothetical protein
MRAIYSGMSIMFTILLVTGLTAALNGCSKSGGDDSDSAKAEVSLTNVRSLCFEGAFRDGTHCAGITNSAAMSQICDVMAHGSGSCAGLPNADFENTCKAGLYGTDSCDPVSDANLKQACKAAAYGSASFCDNIR